MTSIVASVVEKKVALAHETNGDMGNGWLKTNSAGLRRLQAGLVEGQRKRQPARPIPASAWAPRQLKRVVVRHVPEPASQRLLLEKARRRLRPRPDAGPDQAAAGNPDDQGRVPSQAANTFYMGLNLGYEPLANPKVRAGDEDAWSTTTAW